MTNKTGKLIRKRILGVRLIATGHAMPSAYLIYEEAWLIGEQYVTEITYGHALRTIVSYSDLNDTNKKNEIRNMDTLHPEYATRIRAANMLLKEIEDACVVIDQKHGILEV